MKALWLFTTFIRGYIRFRPLTAVLMSSIFTLIAAMLANPNLSDEFRMGCFWMMGLCLCWYVASASRYKATILTLVLCGLLVVSNAGSAEQQPTQEALPIAVGVVVICVGGVCVYKIIQFCQEKFPKEKKDEDKKLTGATPEEEEYGAAFNYSSIGSCSSHQDIRAASGVHVQPTTFTIGIEAQRGGGVRTTLGSASGEESTQSFQQFQAEAATHGLLVTGTYEYRPSFERNRVMVPAEQVPLSFNQDTQTVTHSGYGAPVAIVVERSSDMITWTSLLSVQVSEGSKIEVVDTTVTSQMFYRVVRR